MSASLIIALAANAEGTKLMKAGNLQDAVRAFKDALMRIKSFMSCGHPTEEAFGENCIFETIRAPYLDQTEANFAIFDQFFLPMPLLDSNGTLVLSKNKVDLLIATFLYNTVLLSTSQTHPTVSRTLPASTSSRLRSSKLCSLPRPHVIWHWLWPTTWLLLLCTPLTTRYLKSFAV